MRFFGVFHTSLIAIFLASLVVNSSEELFMTYHPSKSADHISLTCASKDDRAALVWNYDLEQPSSAPKAFSTIWPRITPKCALVAPNGCIVRWEESNAWAVVDSSDHPMGPVFDSRWEDFAEYSFSLYDWNDTFVKNLTQSNTIVFSVRATRDLYVRLCKQDKESVNSGLRIVRRRHFAKSAVYSCPSEASKSSLLFQKKISYKERRYYAERIDTSENEWRTFVLKWDNRHKRLKVHEAKLPIETKCDECTDVKLPFENNRSEGRVRFHFYKYHLTTTSNIELATSEFNHKERSFCIELLVSVCSKCQLLVHIVDKRGFHQIIGNVSGDGHESYDQLPTWQAVQMSANLSINYENPIRLEIINSMTKPGKQGRWAIDTFRKCASRDTVRSVTSVEDSTSNIQCQKLSYSENCLVRSDAEAIRNILNTQAQVDSPETSHIVKMEPLNHSWNLNFIWIAILSIIVICLLLISILCWKRKCIRRQKKAPASIKYVDEAPLSLIHAYDDEQSDGFTHLLDLQKFEDYVKQGIINGEIAIKFEMLPKGMVQPSQYGNLPKNKSKNRYGNLIAYDKTRVLLGTGSLGCTTDYINANYIHGYCKKKAYIATQGPKSNTVVDFWRMIWQEEVRVICMLVNVYEGGKKMCEQYWPEIGKTVEHGHIKILTIDQRVYAHYTYRTFQLTTRHQTGSLKVKHLHYTGWPAQTVPMYSDSIVEYLNELRATPPGPGPIVVHCSAGTGRTGTIILCDICLRHTAAEGMVDPFIEARKMFEARANMLDNLQQYMLVHLMPTQCLFLPSTKLSCSDVTPGRIEELKRELTAHMQRIAVCPWKRKVLRPSKPLRLPSPEHIAKIRFPKLMPVEQNLVTLKRYPEYEKHSDYINAVSVDGVYIKKKYIASQLPLPTTLSDCWRLVAENKVELVIILQRPSQEDWSCVDVIPNERTSFNPVPYLKVEHKMRFYYGEHFEADQLLLTDSSGEETRTQNVTVLTCNNWSLADDANPPPPEALTALWSTSESISRAELAPTLILCRDGVTGCGLYLALSFLLETMTVEQELDVISAVRAVRRSRPEFVKSKAQFEYLYDAAVKFLEGFETYSNFK